MFLTMTSLISLVQYKASSLEADFRYLGYFLNPNKYKIDDWMWLVKKIEKKN